jgi:hypothetical protein
MTKAEILMEASTPDVTAEPRGPEKPPGLLAEASSLASKTLDKRL